MVARLRIQRSSPGYEDAVGEGLVALTQAANSYDASRGAFSTYAWPRVTGAVKDWMSLGQRELAGLDTSEVPACVEEQEPEDFTELRLHVVLREATPALHTAAERALRALMWSELGDAPGRTPGKIRRHRARRELAALARVAEQERAQ